MALSVTQYIKFIAVGVRVTSGQPQAADPQETASLLATVGRDRAGAELWTLADTAKQAARVAAMSPGELAEFWSQPPDPSLSPYAMNPRTALEYGRPSTVNESSMWLEFAKFMGWTDIAEGLVALTVKAQELVRGAIPEVQAAKPSNTGWWVAAAFFAVIVADKVLGGRR